MAATTVDLPAPDAPNSAVTPLPGNANGDVQRETGKGVAQRDLDAHARARRWMSSASVMKISASAMESSDRRIASASPPGSWSAV